MNELHKIIEMCREFHMKGWVPATSGNFSFRISDDTICITASGKHKGKLTEKDFITIRFQDIEKFEVVSSQDGSKPSYETPLHIAIYLLMKDIKAVFHVHSTNSVAVSFLYQNEISVSEFEIIKAFGLNSHKDMIHIPIFDNSQDIPVLSKKVIKYFGSSNLHNGIIPGFILRGHGVYSFGKDVNDAYIKLEAMDHIFEVLLKIGAIQENNKKEESEIFVPKIINKNRCF